MSTSATITDLTTIGPKTKARLIDHGYTTIDDLRRASAEELLAVPGVGISTLRKLIDVD